MLVGASALPFVVDMRAQVLLMGVHFVPGGAFPFFSAPGAGSPRTCRVDDSIFAPQLRGDDVETPLEQRRGFLGRTAVQRTRGGFLEVGTARSAGPAAFKWKATSGLTSHQSSRRFTRGDRSNHKTLLTE